MADTDEVDIPESGMDLLGQLVMANYRDYVATTNRLTENLNERVDELEATLDCIRTELEFLFDKPYMPMPHTILAMLYPDREHIDRYRKGVE